jgi:diguanylate cyclase (GGDEF)-like protein
MTMPLYQLLLIGGTATVLAAALGFVAGFLYGRTSFERLLRRASRSVGDLVDVLVRSLEQAQRAGGLLEAMQGVVLATDQAERLERGRGRLLATLSNVVRPRPAAATDEPAPKPTPKPVKFSLKWTREPLCERTSVPSRSAFEENLGALFEASSKSSKSFGVMLISVDKYDGLRLRFGIDAAEAFLQQTARMILHGVRDSDLVCRYNTDTFAVLLPEVDAPSAGNVARTVRDTLRAHRFSADATSPEVHVTTSLGLALCHPGENLPLLLGRVGEALGASRRKGRNQVHVHDGKTMSLCASV